MPSSWIGADGTWINSRNWSGGIPDAEGAIANFNFFNQVSPLMVTLPWGMSMTVGVLNFNNATAGVTLTGDSPSTGVRSFLVFDHTTGSTPAINHNSSGTLTFEANGSLTLVLAETTIFNAASTGRIMVRADITGPGGIVKTGPGELYLTDQASSQGGLQIDGGTVTLGYSGNSGPGAIGLANGSALRFEGSGTIANTIGTAGGGSAAAGSGQLHAAVGRTVTLTGSLNHLGSGTFTFGSATDTGRIIANLAGIGHNAAASSFAIEGGVLQLGNASTAANLLTYNGTGTTAIESGGWLDAGGFVTYVSNLDLNGGGIYTTSGALRVNATMAAGLSQNGSFTGTTAADSVALTFAANGDLSGVAFNSWTAGSDSVTIHGSNAGNALVGSAVGDTINGNGGLDVIQGGLGDDTIVLNSANGGSWADGGGGTDKLTLTGGTLSLGTVSGFEALELQSGAILQMSSAQYGSAFTANAALSGTGTVRIAMSSSDFAFTGQAVANGSNLTFEITGTNGADTIKGILGATNIITAGQGADQIRGGRLGDTIYGGDGDDKMGGGQGADILYGGAGADTFRYPNAQVSGLGVNADRIMDFVSGTDAISFAALDADPVAPGQQGLSYIGTAAFSATGTAQLRWQTAGADIRVDVDLDGNGAADMQIFLAGLGGGTLTSADFLL